MYSLRTQGSLTAHESKLLTPQELCPGSAADNMTWSFPFTLPLSTIRLLHICCTSTHPTLVRTLQHRSSTLQQVERLQQRGLTLKSVYFFFPTHLHLIFFCKKTPVFDQLAALHSSDHLRTACDPPRLRLCQNKLIMIIIIMNKSGYKGRISLLYFGLSSPRLFV